MNEAFKYQSKKPCYEGEIKIKIEKPDKLSVLQTKVDKTLFSLKIEKEDLSLDIKGKHTVLVK